MYHAPSIRIEDPVECKLIDQCQITQYCFLVVLMSAHSEEKEGDEVQHFVVMLVVRGYGEGS